MIKILARWFAILAALWAAFWIVAGRELHRVVIGGYTRGDPRHPVQTARRIAALEHELGLDKVEGAQTLHEPEVCEQCDPDKRYEVSRKAWVPAGDWLCLTCDETGKSNLTLRSHWVSTDHLDYDMFDDWYDAHYTVGKKKMPSLYRDKNPNPPREHFRWGSARGDNYYAALPPTTYLDWPPVPADSPLLRMDP